MSRRPAGTLKAHLIVDDTSEEQKHSGVSLTLRKDPDHDAIVDIADTGIGMTGAFIETETF